MSMSRLSSVVSAILFAAFVVVLPQFSQAVSYDDPSFFEDYLEKQKDQPKYRLQGRILLQVEEHGEAWYIDPTDHHRYYLGRPADAFDIMRYLGHGISNDDLARIAIAGDSWKGDTALVERMRGKILLQVEKHGEAWYVHPDSGQRYYLGRPADAFQIMRELSLGATTEDIFAISPNVLLIPADFTSLSSDDEALLESLGIEGFPRQQAILLGSGRVNQNIGGWKVEFPDGTTYVFPYRTELTATNVVAVDRYYADDIYQKSWLSGLTLLDLELLRFRANPRSGGSGVFSLRTQNGTLVSTGELSEASF